MKESRRRPLSEVGVARYGTNRASGNKLMHWDLREEDLKPLQLLQHMHIGKRWGKRSHDEN